MSTYVTVVRWSRVMTEDENQNMLKYIDAQTGENGKPMTYKGEYARSWTDEATANAFSEFAKTLQENQAFPTKVSVYMID